MIRKLLLATAGLFVGKKLWQSRDRLTPLIGESWGRRASAISPSGAAAADIADPADTRASGTGSSSGGEHVPTDLMGDHHPGPNDRAVEAFRPDPHAPVAPEDRDAFRPATIPASV